MPVTLFADQVIMGQKGVLSEEDASSFGLSQRVRLSSDFVIPPDRYRLAMSPVPYFPRAAVPESSHGAVTVSSSLPHFIDFSTAQFRCELEDPDGRTTVCGMGAIAGVDDGILQTAEPAELDLENFGRYQVRIAGTVRDRTGHEYEFGGTYKFWVALPLSFSTASKTGSSFHVGSVFPTKVQIHPLVPAYVTLCVRHYPQSDPARVREKKTFEGYANHFGYFPPTGRKPLVFDEPGEYVAEILAAYRQENGTLWIGSQKAAGVVAEDNPSVTVHGARIDLYPQKYKDVVVHLPTRGIAPDEASNGMTRYIDVSDCKDLTPPFWSGDILATPTGLDNSNNIMALMAQDVHDSALLRTEEERWSRFVEEGREPDGTTADAVTLPGVIAVFHGADGERPGQWPILSSHRRGYSPYDFPEGASLINYTYFTAIRPGFPAFTMVTDSTPFHAYWNPSPNGFGGQINAGPTGDLPQDMYRIDAGLVYRDLESGRNSYAAYTATVVIDPTETYARGITRVGERPLFSVAGVDYDLFLALEAAAILEPGN
ncbi:MAG: hypothetical protein M5R36_14020 [Deltaproteobacteria bacterium]|nr:hypothetical protein [Deltaproteobacteria bacterium]